MRAIASKLYQEFFQSEKSGGLLLMFATSIALLSANSYFSEQYLQFWDKVLFGYTVQFWINDALMTIFFLLVGLEIEREIIVGELSDIKDAILPIFAAAGGMLVPAAIYFLCNFNTGDLNGFGIPMATDIAFSLGILSLMGNRVPLVLKIFLTALAIIDDMGAILIIALFYSDGVALNYIIAAIALIAFMIFLRRKVTNLIWPYLILGVVLWYFLHESGIHATISGVILAFLIPFNKKNDESPSYRLQHLLHKPVALFILPVFALANTNINLDGSSFEHLMEPMAIGIILGLFIGKPLGILLFSFIAVKLKLSQLPDSIRWTHIIGLGWLAGIGFTMSIFISLLAFNDNEQITLAKLATLLASLLSAIIGFIILNNTLTIDRTKNFKYKLLKLYLSIRRSS